MMKASVLRVAAALMIVAASLAAAVLPAGVVTAAVINVPGDQPTITAAVAAANPAGGDTIVVAPGTYSESEITIDRSLTIQGAGPGATIVDGVGLERIFHISGAGTTAAMSGLAIRDGVVSNFLNNDSFGAGIWNEGTLTLTECGVTGNDAWSHGGNGYGGGIYNEGTLTLNNCVVQENSATTDTKSAWGGGIASASTLEMTGCVVTGNIAKTGFLSAWGGGVDNRGTASLTDCSVSGNTAEAYEEAYGGGLANWDSGQLTLSDCTVEACQVYSAYRLAAGGGILNHYGTLTINGSTLSNNIADGSGEGRGGGIQNDGGTLSMTNCTVSGNQVYGGDSYGGGVGNDGGTLSMTNCTVTQNLADYYSGEARAGGIWNNAPLDLICTIVYGNTATDGPGDLLLIGAPPYTKVNSIVGDPDGDPDPLLGPLQDNGGPTLTCALLEGSAAIDTCQNCSVSKDQRGEPRAQAALCDIGAYELQQGRRPPTVPAVSLWGAAGLAVVLVCLVAWSVRRRLISGKHVS